MTNALPDVDWRLDCTVTLTQAEAKRLTELAHARRLSKSGSAEGWRLFAIAIALGFAVPFVAVLTGAAPPDKAGVIAVSAFLACWAAIVMDQRAGRRVQKRLQAEGLDSIGWRYSIRADPRGLRAVVPHHRAEFDWAFFTSAELRVGFVLLWTKNRGPVGIPVRCLPPDWTVAGLLERM